MDRKRDGCTRFPNTKIKTQRFFRWRYRIELEEIKQQIDKWNKEYAAIGKEKRDELLNKLGTRNKQSVCAHPCEP